MNRVSQAKYQEYYKSTDFQVISKVIKKLVNKILKWPPCHSTELYEALNIEAATNYLTRSKLTFCLRLWNNEFTKNHMPDKRWIEFHRRSIKNITSQQRIWHRCATERDEKCYHKQLRWKKICKIKRSFLIIKKNNKHCMFKIYYKYLNVI